MAILNFDEPVIFLWCCAFGNISEKPMPDLRLQVFILNGFFSDTFIVLTLQLFLWPMSILCMVLGDGLPTLLNMEIQCSTIALKREFLPV